MTRVMVDCPKTGVPVYIGVDLPRRMFRWVKVPPNTISPCPECGSEHTFEKKEMYLEVEDGQPSANGASHFSE